MLQLRDLLGLNETPVLDMPIVRGASDLDALLIPQGPPIALAGARGAQGGHTMIREGRVALTEGMTRPIELDTDGLDPSRPADAHLHRPRVTVPAGATWSEVHSVVAPYGLSPLVHQSSAGFSIGGSLSVNCHGRDPRQGPIGNTVNWIDVLQSAGVVRASRTESPELFRAAIGGYGAVGPILRANFNLTPNVELQPVAQVIKPSKYARALRQMARDKAAASGANLHYGWLKCTSPDEMYSEVLAVDYKEVSMPALCVESRLKSEAWGTTELLRAGWVAARDGDRRMRGDVWRLMCENAQGATASRINWMRAAVGFTLHHSATEAGLLQEYFVPAGQFDAMRQRLAQIFVEERVNVLSTTIRLVQRDEVGVNLSYCADGPMACFAVDVSVAVKNGSPEPRVRRWVNRANEAAIELGGRFYLPYWRFASRPQVRAAYSAGWAAQREAIARFNPQRRWWNEFLQAYF